MKIAAIQHSNKNVDCKIQLSSSKSLCNRLLVMQYLSGDAFELENISDSADSLHLQKAIENIKKKNPFIDIGHAGTCMRFLTSLLSITQGNWHLTGSDRMKQRPIGELVNALRELGAKIEYLEKDGYPPLSIEGQILNGGIIKMKGSVSSQFISSLLLIAPKLKNGINIEFTDEPVSLPYLQMTVALLKQAKVEVELLENRLMAKGSYQYSKNQRFFIEGDWSSASYLYGVCALLKNSTINIEPLDKNSLQADSVLPEIYRLLGVDTNYTNTGIQIRHIGNTLEQFQYDFSNCPDIAQTVAVTCAALRIPAILSGLKTLRIKETDRIQALKNELSKIGAEIKVNGNESIEILPHNALNNKNEVYTFPTYHDHRMAMAFAPLAILQNKIKIESPEVVEKSYKSFWDDFKKMGFEIKIENQ